MSPGVETPIRTEQIRPPSLRRETAMVLKAAFHIVYWSALVILGRPEAGGASGAAAAELPFERRFQDLEPSDQRLFRSLQEGLLEAEGERSRSGQWPPAEALAQRGIPPFAADPIDRAHYRWRLLRKQNLINYLGAPAPESGRRSFVVIITEPDAQSPNDPQTPIDELHHRLQGGMMIHVAVWMGPGLGDAAEPVSFVSPDDGWLRVIVAPGAR
jgi:hypothetical protein